MPAFPPVFYRYFLVVGVCVPSTDIDIYTEKKTIVDAYINYLSDASIVQAVRENLNFQCESPGMGTLLMESSKRYRQWSESSRCDYKIKLFANL